MLINTDRVDQYPLPVMAAAVVAGAMAAIAIVWGTNDMVMVMLGLSGLGGLALFPRLEVGLYVLVFIIYLNLSSVIVNVHGGPSLLKPLLPLFLGAILARSILVGERFGDIRSVLPVLMVYGGTLALSFFVASDIGLVSAGLSAYIKDATLVLIIVLLLQRARHVRGVFWAMLLAGAALGSISIFQQVTATFDNNYWGFTQTAEAEHIIGEVNSHRAAGPISTNFYAMIMLALVPLGLDRFRSESRLLLKVMAAVVLGICVSTVILTFSRGGFMALGAASLYWSLRQRVRLIALVKFVPILVVVFALAPSNYTARLLTSADALPFVGADEPVGEASVRGRLSEQLAAWRMFNDHPILGVGFDNYDVNYLGYSEEIGLDSRREERQAHNLYLEVAAETGIVGLLATFAVVAVAFRRLHLARTDFAGGRRSEYAAMAVALEAGLVGYLVASIFLHAAFPRYLWLYVGLAYALPNVVRNEHAALQRSAQAPRLARRSYRELAVQNWSSR